jgi:hypothetical protein
MLPFEGLWCQVRVNTPAAQPAHPAPLQGTFFSCVLRPLSAFERYTPRRSLIRRDAYAENGVSDFVIDRTIQSWDLRPNMARTFVLLPYSHAVCMRQLIPRPDRITIFVVRSLVSYWCRYGGTKISHDFRIGLLQIG